jgi:hypothetical protein
MKDPLYNGEITVGKGTKAFQPIEQDEYNQEKRKSIDFFKADVWAFGIFILLFFFLNLLGYTFWVLFVKESDYEKYLEVGGPGIAPDFKVCSPDMPKEVKELMIKCFQPSELILFFSIYLFILRT